MRSIFLVFILFFSSINNADYRLGVLVNDKSSTTEKMWSPLANYLTQQISQHRFTIAPLKTKELTTAIKKQQVDLALVDPLTASELKEYHPLPIANVILLAWQELFLAILIKITLSN